jgi:hypothetical protein
MPEDSPAGRQRLERALEERRGTEEGEEFKPIRRGWCLGEEKFREELLTQMSERMGAERYGEERAEELKLGRWQEADLKTRPKGDSVKVALAARLRAETTMTVGWIAERMAMGTRGYLNHLLYRRRKRGGEYTISRTDPFAYLNHLLYRRRKLGGEYTISRTEPFGDPFGADPFTEGTTSAEWHVDAATGGP